jgi:hypothetical protein
MWRSRAVRNPFSVADLFSLAASVFGLFPSAVAQCLVCSVLFSGASRNKLA